MKKVRIKKNLLHLSIFMNFVLLFYFIKFMPVFTYRRISRCMGSLVFFLMASTRQRVLKNLRIAYGPGLKPEERRRITMDLFYYTILSFCDLVRVTKISDEKLFASVHIEGEEKLRAALLKGNGAVGVCSHMGNFPLVETVLVKKGYPANVIVKDPTAEYFAKFCRKLALSENVPYISKKDIRSAVEEARIWISKKRGLLSFYLDQHASSGVIVNFFGKKVSAPTGAAVFARKYDAPALGVFSYRMKNGRHRIIIEGPYSLQKTGNQQEDLKYNTALFMERVEYYVKVCPEQWFSWLHRRFR